MFFFEDLVYFSFLLVDDAIDGPRIYIFLILEQMQYLEDGGGFGVFLFELDDSLLGVDPIQQGQVLFGDLDQRVSSAMQEEGGPTGDDLVEIVAGVGDGGAAGGLVGADGLDGGVFVLVGVGPQVGVEEGLTAHYKVYFQVKQGGG
jgi:hypothetical protein